MQPDAIPERKASEQLRSFLDDCGIEDPRGRRLLEIGFKNGRFLHECDEAGLVPTGVEINREYCLATRRRYPRLDLLWYDGGTIPLPDGSFDYVVSFQVLEHVASLEHVLRECARLLRPGGTMYHRCPNYHSFYEGHCKVVWLPFLDRRMGRLYLRAVGRYHPVFETLNLVRPATLRRVVGRCGRLRLISLGRAEFIRRFDPHQARKVDEPSLRKVLLWLARRPRLSRFLLALAARADVYYPITMIARKAPDE